eukprot:m.442901 g.442901  ORF g.442901 m.442901 type:complete len:81 (+) comp56817_c0_seq56:775-1017(+)
MNELSFDYHVIGVSFCWLANAIVAATIRGGVFIRDLESGDQIFHLFYDDRFMCGLTCSPRRLISKAVVDVQFVDLQLENV